MKTPWAASSLGLAIVHGVITRAGGRIEVDSSPAGTTFSLHLPAAAAGVGANEEAVDAMAGAGAG